MIVGDMRDYGVKTTCGQIFVAVFIDPLDLVSPHDGKSVFRLETLENLHKKKNTGNDCFVSLMALKLFGVDTIMFGMSK